MARTIDDRELFLRGDAATETSKREPIPLLLLAQSEWDLSSWGRGAAARGASVVEEREREKRRERERRR